jgi:hypothetical protein
MDNREEMRRLIDVIEKSANNSPLTQAIDAIRLFSNTASFLANKLGTRLRNKHVAMKRAAPKATKTVGLSKPPIPKTLNVPNKAEPNSQADFDRLEPQGSQGPIPTS